MLLVYEDVETQVYAIYALYVLYETQSLKKATSERLKITAPERTPLLCSLVWSYSSPAELWAILAELKHVRPLPQPLRAFLIVPACL